MVLAFKDKVNQDFFWVTGGDDSRFDAGLSGGAVHKPGDGKTGVCKNRWVGAGRARKCGRGSQIWVWWCRWVIFLFLKGPKWG